jgi:agmatinase
MSVTLANKTRHYDFLDIPCMLRDAKYVIHPVAYDQGSTWMRGADWGPSAILSASTHMETYDISTNNEPYKAGIYTASPMLLTSLPPEDLTIRVLARTTSWILQDKHVITLGGNHTVSIGAFHAHSKVYGGDISILQIDAHADLRNEYEDSKYNHACAMARMSEHAKSTVGVGIRSLSKSEIDNQTRDNHLILASDIQADPTWIYRAKEYLVSDNVYVTIDVDGFDPSIMPATGTPEPGGLTWYEVINLLTLVVATKNVIGFDVVELCPNETSYPSNFLAAKLIYRILAMLERKHA